MKRHELTEEQWNKLKDLLPPAPHAWRKAQKRQPDHAEWDFILAEYWDTLVGSAGAMVDGLRNPLRLLLSPGTRNDICYARKLLKPFDLRGKYVIADKGYDSDKSVRWLEERGATVVTSSRKIAKHPRSIDRNIFMERHLVENLFLKLKVHRRFTTRYEKRASVFLLSLSSPPSSSGFLQIRRHPLVLFNIS